MLNIIKAHTKIKPAEMMTKYLKLKPVKEMATRLLTRSQVGNMHAHRQSA